MSEQGEGFPRKTPDSRSPTIESLDDDPVCAFTHVAWWEGGTKPVALCATTASSLFPPPNLHRA